MANRRGVAPSPLRQRHCWMLVLLGVTLGVWLSGCSIGYLWHVTVGQAKLLTRQQAVTDVLRDSQLSPAEQQKIRLILDVRTFAIEQLVGSSQGCVATVYLAFPHCGASTV